MPPKLLAKNADRAGGVLPVTVAARAAPPKPPASRLKLEIRRLPPGLTLSEFEEVLGEEWKLGGGRVDWREYRTGKTRAAGSGRASEQSRCYLHVTSEAAIRDFERRFLEVVFHDKAGTHRSPDLKHLPPTLGFAPNQRTPLQQAKPRTDNRQGTIDQDAEFIAFLEAETQPIAKPPALDSLVVEKENVVVKSTPLIDDLRERKANKAKAAQAKAEKSKEKKVQAAKSNGKEVASAGSKEGSGKQRVEAVAKEAAKVLTKQAAAKQQQQQQQQQQASAPAAKSQSAKSKKQANAQQPKPANATPTQPASSVPSAPANAAPQRGAQRQRGNAEGIKKMLQKDLGIKPKPQAAAQASHSTPVTPAPSTSANPSTPSGPKQKQAVEASESNKSAPPPVGDKKERVTKAYLKHANPSQGMTEALIQSALAQYGTVTNVAIDPRKGTAMAVFDSPESLKKALGAKRVPVAGGAVEVLEYRERNVRTGGRSDFSRGKGAARGGRDGGTANAHGPAASATSAASTQGT